LLAPHPTPKLEDHSLSVVRDYLLDIVYIKRRLAVVTGTHIARLTYHLKESPRSNTWDSNRKLKDGHDDINS